MNPALLLWQAPQTNKRRRTVTQMIAQPTMVAEVTQKANWKSQKELFSKPTRKKFSEPMKVVGPLAVLPNTNAWTTV